MYTVAFSFIYGEFTLFPMCIMWTRLYFVGFSFSFVMHFTYIFFTLFSFFSALPMFIRNSKSLIDRAWKHSARWRWFRTIDFS